MKRVLMLIAVAAVVVSASTAQAQRRRVYYGGAPDVAGPVKLDIRLGPFFDVNDYSNQFMLGFAVGFDLTPRQRNHIYLDFPLEFGLGNDFTFITIMPGIEADIRLPTPFPMFIYPRAGIGVAVSHWGGYCDAYYCYDTSTESGFGLRFGVGLKFLITPVVHFFVEPLNVLFFPAGFNGTPTIYNLALGVGFNV